MKQKLAALGILKPEIHIDWLDDCKCIGIQGKTQDCYVDVQATEKSFSVAWGKDEPDEPREYPLETAEQVYSVLERVIEPLS